jgi:large subunit ribosomal protein L24
MQRIKKGDTVQILAGKDRGKVAKVLSVFPKNNTALVEGVNQFKKNSRPKKQGEKGEIITITRPLPLDRVALHCGSCNKGVRVGYRRTGSTAQRVCRTCGTSIA